MGEDGGGGGGGGEGKRERKRTREREREKAPDRFEEIPEGGRGPFTIHGVEVDRGE